MKACFKCGTIKPIADFYVHPQMADGHLNKCKSCTKSDAWNRRHIASREKVLAYDRKRARSEERRQALKEVARKWASDHPDRRRAQIIVGNAIRAGRLMPWPVCALPTCCDKPEAHHPDYSMPLAVVWLCRSHHMQAHAQTRA